MKTNTVADERDRTNGKKGIAGMGQSTKPVNESVLIQSRQAALALQDEFEQWERLSDDALADFEKGIT